MPEYKIIDYTVPTPGELARLICDHAGVEYEDVRYDRDNAKEAEDATPFGVLPVLEVDGVIVAQQTGMCRFLAREHGLGGSNNQEDAKCDMIMDGIWDMLARPRQHELDKMEREERLALLLTVVEEDVPRYMDYFEKILAEGGTDYFAGSNLTWCDLAVGYTFNTFRARVPVLLDDHPLLRAHTDRIGELPAVKALVEKRLQQSVDE